MAIRLQGCASNWTSQEGLRLLPIIPAARPDAGRAALCSQDLVERALRAHDPDRAVA